MQNDFLNYFFNVNNGKVTVTAQGIIVISVIVFVLLFLLVRILKLIKFRKKENAYFHKYIKRLERDESLDRSIDIIQKTADERCFVRLVESGPNVSREYTLEVKGELLGGSAFSKCKIFINDELVEPVHFRLSFENRSLKLTSLSSVQPTELVHTSFTGVKKVHCLENGETFTLKSADVLRVGSTSISIFAFSNENGII